MKNENSFAVAVIKAGTLMFCSCFVLVSCLKNKDSTDKGPKSHMTITNYVVNGSLNVFFDNALITATPLSFGTSISAGTGIYLPFAAGLHNIKFNSGTNVIADNTLSLDTAGRYSLFVYDTLKNNKVKALLLIDDLTVVDTIAKARFIQFIPVADSIKLVLSNGAIAYSIQDGYQGNKSSTESVVDFSLSLPPDTYQVQLIRNGVTIAQQAAVNVIAGNYTPSLQEVLSVELAITRKR